MHHVKWARWGVAAFLVAAGCSSSPAASDDGTTDAWFPDIMLTDLFGDPGPKDLGTDRQGEAGEDAADEPDVAEDPGTLDAAEDASDIPSPDTADGGGIGDFRRPCKYDSDCESGYCVPTNDGLQCSTGCVDSCPEGWACRPVNAGAMVVTLCLPPDFNLCRPCKQDADCRQGTQYPMPGLLCAPLGAEEGLFCLPACANPLECTDGSTCEELAGAPSKVCVPAARTCDCSPAAVTAGAETTCTRTADGIEGTCRGFRNCGANGLSSCNARTPATEACNGADDDCDGATDEENAQGCTTFYLDVDGDGYGLDGDSRCLCKGEGRYTALMTGDCEDRDPSIRPGIKEACNGVDDNCNGETDEEGADGCTSWFTDGDGDSFGARNSERCLCGPSSTWVATQGGDCDDFDPSVRPGAPEYCNNKDDNCNGQTDEEGAHGCSTFYIDGDRDTWGWSKTTKCLCSPKAPYDAVTAGDCNDADAGAFPGAPEKCNLKDDNCDGRIDEDGALNCRLWFYDADGDGFGLEGDTMCRCQGSGKYSASKYGDCDDTDNAVFPGAAEACNGLDDDCNGIVDDENANGCELWFKDGDGDGFGDEAAGRCLCHPDGLYGSKLPGDCNDAAPSAHPGGIEVCGNGIDDDCNGETDEVGCQGCTVYYRDGDQDSYGVASETRCLSAPDPVLGYTATVAGDCNDADASVHPNAVEGCNGKDDNCNGTRDEPGSVGCVAYYKDADGDGSGVGAPQCLCGAIGLFSAKEGGDCDDGDRTVHPGAAEACNGKDDDCNGVTDGEGATGCKVFYRDEDADGYGTADAKCLCVAAAPYAAPATGDCDDGRAEVHPGAKERCNGRDDDCDGKTDDEGAVGCTVFFADRDGDRVGVSAESKCLCAPAAPLTALTGGDCNDVDPLIFAGAMENCNGVDDNCNGLTDEAGAYGCTTYYMDWDRDGYGVSGDLRCLCLATGRYDAILGGDCDDKDPAITPSSQELCKNQKDDDCDGQTDEAGCLGCTRYYVDADGDGFGLAADYQCLGEATGKYVVTVAGDCDDLDKNVHPGGREVCNNQKDDNCNGETDEDGAAGCNTWYLDLDRDGFGQPGSAACRCRGDAPYDAPLGGDCNDASPAVAPGAGESCNGVDDNCDGQTDEPGAFGCVVYAVDLDKDGWGVAEGTRCLCGPTGDWTATRIGDCSDFDGDVFPGATERCNGKDDNCNAQTDEENATGCVNLYFDFDGDGYGVGNSRCLCTTGGGYAATQSGDCNDMDPVMNPGSPEVCDGKDDNCDGIVDPVNTTGCSLYYWDGDVDGVGTSARSQCLCGPSGKYTSKKLEDCNDADALVYPGAVEVCNKADDNCNGIVDDEGATGCTNYWYDGDADGFGIADPHCLCGPTVEYGAKQAGDCCDRDFNTNPGQLGWFTSPNGCGNFDYDCNGNGDRRYTWTGTECSGFFSCSGGDEGWYQQVASCGATADWIYDCSSAPSCNTKTTSRTQECH